MTLIETLEGLHREKDLLLFDPSTGEELTEEELGPMSKLSLNTCKSAIDLLTNSNRQYERLFDSLKFNWILNCEHDDKLTDKIERCEAALTTLRNLGFNLCTGEVNKE